MLKNLNSYEKVFLYTPILTVVFALLLYASNFIDSDLGTTLVYVTGSAISFIILVGYLYAYVARRRYATVLKSALAKREVYATTTWRERRLFDFCILFSVIAFFLLIMFATGSPLTS